MIERKLDRLESMRASLSPSQQKELDQNKQAVEQISARTRELYKLIDQPGADLKSARFRSSAQSLANNAGSLARSSA